MKAKRVTVYDILAEDVTRKEVIYARGTRKQIELLYHSIIGESHCAKWIETERGLFLIHGYGSLRTTHPERADACTLFLPPEAPQKPERSI